ncbi:MAG: ABC transporter permease [Ilumatobacter sp.]|nr:MAG: ABC transporter permease [Ilumatobacter sp.]
MSSPRPLTALAAARVVAQLQLRRRLRDRSALIQGVLAPILLAVIVSAAFGGERSFSTTIGVVDLDGGALSTPFLDESDDAADDVTVQFVVVADEATARAAIDARDLPAAIVIPDGFADSLEAEPLAIRVLVDPGRGLASDIARSVAVQLASSIDTTRIAVASAIATDPSLAVTPGIDALAVDAAALPSPVVLSDSAFGDGFDPITYFAPSMAILFAFLTLGAGARTLIVERREGTLARIRAAPITDRAVLAGVTASVVVLGLVSFAVVWLVTAVVFGADWGEPLPVAVVIIATVLAVAGISTLVTGLARTEAQADGASSVLAFGFALIGGGFLSPGDLPDLLARVALITPNRWALDAFAELGAGASGVSAVATPVAVLLAIGIVTGGIGLRRVALGAP